MEASLASEYAAALTHKRKKEALLSEFENIQQDLYNTTANQEASSDDGSSSAQARKKAVANTVPVRFSVNAKTNFGDTVIVCGNIPELGNWDTTYGPELTYVKGKNTWGATLQLPKGSNFRFKFLIGVPRENHDEHNQEAVEDEGGLTEGGARASKRVEYDYYWQDGADRAIQMPLDEVISMDVVVDWDSDREKEKMWVCMPVPLAAVAPPDGTQE